MTTARPRTSWALAWGLGAVFALGACVTPEAQDTRMTGITIVAFGDSTTAGTPAFQSPVEAPPDGSGDIHSQFSYWLMQTHPDWQVLNRGVNGERTDQIAARFDRDVLAHHPKAMTILAGVNDVYQGRPLEFATTQLRAMYDKALAAGIPVVACSIIPYNSATPEQNAKMHAINDWIRAQVAKDARMTFIDTRAAAAKPGDLDHLAGSPDGLHPDVAGYHRMADAIEPALRKILAAKTSR